VELDLEGNGFFFFCAKHLVPQITIHIRTFLAMRMRGYVIVPGGSKLVRLGDIA